MATGKRSSQNLKRSEYTECPVCKRKTAHSYTKINRHGVFLVLTCFSEGCKFFKEIKQKGNNARKNK
jgi:hypothetical protein